MDKKIFIVMLVPLLLLIVGCSLFAPLNDSPPDYIKDIVGLKEGDGILIYFTLADKNGQMTTAEGNVYLTIVEENYYSGEKVLYKASYPIKKEHFRKTEVGLGAFAHEVILVPLGRIPYSSFTQEPKESSGKIKLTFVTSSKTELKGEESIYF